jgi:FeS assembly SUF system protein
MKRLFNLFKDRDAGNGAAAPPVPDPREAWRPEGVEPAASPPVAAPALEAVGDQEGAVPPPVLLPLEGHPLEAAITEALRSVYDPEIPVNIYELGLIYAVMLSPEHVVFVKMTLTAPGCPVAGQMPGMVRAAIEEHVPEARAVDVEIVWDPPWTPDMMSEAAKLETGML